jgi:hypothetical protein
MENVRANQQAQWNNATHPERNVDMEGISNST